MTNLTNASKVFGGNMFAMKNSDSISFNELPLHTKLQNGLKDAGFTHTTPIQTKALPIALQGLDIAGQAQTGTGKTIAFLLSTMQTLLKSPSIKHPRALILAPTRELALQIKDDADLIGIHTRLKSGCLIGGSSYDKQKNMLDNGVDILIATPGRLIDLFKQKLVTFKSLEVVVMDEADRMFDMGFIKDIRYILNRAPKPIKRQGLLFSATLSYKVMELAYSHMNQPKKVSVNPEKIIANKLSEKLYFPANNEKQPLLVGLMRKLSPEKSIVFVNTKHQGEKVWGVLKANGFDAYLLSGDVQQNQRVRLLSHFKKSNKSVLVATDVAARGLHINEVSHVFNYDLPQDCEDYVHRIGRTARAGLAGDAISLACENYSFSIPDIEEYIGHKIPVESITEECIATELKPPVSHLNQHNKADDRQKTSTKAPKKSVNKHAQLSRKKASTQKKKGDSQLNRTKRKRSPNRNNQQRNKSKNQDTQPQKNIQPVVKKSWWRNILRLD